MMDLTLDYKQSRALDCSSCDPQKMRIRNCKNQWDKSKSPILVNGNVYRSCPRAVVADSWEVGYLVSLYYECRDAKTSPFGGTLMNTTSFCKEAFDLMDSITADYRERERKKQEEEHKKLMRKTNPSGSKKR